MHVFETVIRVLGGLLSGHTLLSQDPSLLDGVYDGIFLRRAVELADRLLPAFDTPSRLPLLFVHLTQVYVFSSTLTHGLGTKSLCACWLCIHK